jgi:hypothetical protein
MKKLTVVMGIVSLMVVLMLGGLHSPASALCFVYYYAEIDHYDSEINELYWVYDFFNEKIFTLFEAEPPKFPLHQTTIWPLKPNYSGGDGSATFEVDGEMYVDYVRITRFNFPGYEENISATNPGDFSWHMLVEYEVKNKLKDKETGHKSMNLLELKDFGCF